MWARPTTPQHAQHQPAPPFPKGCGRAHTRSTEESGKDLTKESGRVKHEGGPIKWKARPVRPKNEPRLSSWFVFPNFCPFLPLTAPVPNDSTSNTSHISRRWVARTRHAFSVSRSRCSHLSNSTTDQPYTQRRSCEPPSERCEDDTSPAHGYATPV